jgi:2-amino-4-hydroxy-6-hydroxymethyldihydropteridine diphosphokinase
LSRVVLGLGSNQGDSLWILEHAIRDLSGVLSDMRISSLYSTTPQDYSDQDDFYNMVVSGLCSLSPRELLFQCQSIESKYGRDRSCEIPSGPRSLDIDIELFDSCIIREEGLIIPHERMYQRQFVLIPLLEIESESADPVSGRPFTFFLEQLPDQGIHKVGTHGN